MIRGPGGSLEPPGPLPTTSTQCGYSVYGVSWVLCYRLEPPDAKGLLLPGVHAPTGHRVLSRKTLQYMTTNHLPDSVDMSAISSPQVRQDLSTRPLAPPYSLHTVLLKVTWCRPPQYSEIAAEGVGFGLGFSSHGRLSH